jgi:nanoRNase/pAp phosphatase (c-di-AMP/oligoRNAs hydrolase)
MATDIASRIDSLHEAFSGSERILVLSHDNPDPDALASACTLQAILDELVDAETTVGYAGLVGRAENRAMMRELELDVTHIGNLDLASFDAIALVDTQPGFGNNSLPARRRPTAVIDHHPARSDLDDIPFVDIREDYGATSTIVAEYAYAVGLRLSPALTTALFYAIKSETQDLGREASEHDQKIYLSLFPHADKPALSRIQTARVPRSYFRVFQLAIENAKVYGRAVLTDVQRVRHPDLVAEIADTLLRLEEVVWSCCMARHGDQMVLSLRTSDPDAHAGSIIREVVHDMGAAGGHGMIAGGRVKLGSSSYLEVAETVRQRLLDALDIDEGDREGEPLVLPEKGKSPPLS